MNVEQAFDLVTRACQTLEVNWPTHIHIQQALGVLRRALELDRYGKSNEEKRP